MPEPVKAKVKSGKRKNEKKKNQLKEVSVLFTNEARDVLVCTDLLW